MEQAPLQHYNLPQMGNAERREDLTSIYQILKRMRATIYENDTHLAQTSLSQPDSTPARHQTGNRATAILPSKHTHSADVPRGSDTIARVVGGLEFLAKRIPTLAEPEGSFVGEITSILYDCLQVRRDGIKSYLSGDPENWAIAYSTGFWFYKFLGFSFAQGYTLSRHRFSLYTPSMRLHKATVIYSRKWYEENRNTRVLDTCTRSMLDQICEVLSTTNIVLYISNDTPSKVPPWKFDDFLKKRLADSNLPSFVSNYYWGLEQHGLASNLLPEHSQNSQGQLYAVKDTFGEARAAATDWKQPLERDRTYEIQKFPWTTENTQGPIHAGVEAMDIDWTVWDNLMASPRDAQSSSNSLPPIVKEQKSQYGIIQPRSPPVIQKLVPAVGTVTGGTEVVLLGNGFYQGLEVLFGDTEATTTTFWGDKCLNCIAPPALQAGTIRIRFKQEHHQDSQMQHQSQLRTCVYKYIDDRDLEMYRPALKGLENNLQRPRDDPDSAPQQQMTEEISGTSLTGSAAGLSPATLNILAIMYYLAGHLAAPTARATITGHILEEMGRALMSLNKSLTSLPLEDDTILLAVLLWSVEKIWHNQDRAESHLDGIKVLIQCRPDFDIARPLDRFFAQASLFLTNREHESMTKVGELMIAAFRSAMEDTMNTNNVGQSVAITSAPTPAATVDSPWSETDAAPPPYMLSPTPLNQACLIYAAVNSRR